MTTRGIMMLVAAIAAALAVLLHAVRSGEPLEVLALAMLVYFGAPIAARVGCRRTLLFWDWFAITGLAYLAVCMAPQPTLKLPTTNWLASQAAVLLPMSDTDFGSFDPTVVAQRVALIGSGQFLISLPLAVLGAVARVTVFAGRAQARDGSAKIIADDACPEPLKRYPF